VESVSKLGFGVLDGESDAADIVAVRRKPGEGLLADEQIDNNDTDEQQSAS
jgi:hypothetical protein